MCAGSQVLALDPPEPCTGAGGAVVLFSDIACPWATVVVLRIHEARAKLGLVDDVRLVHLAYPLELEHRRPLARRVIDAEIPVCAVTTPEFGWSLWQGRLDEYPVTTLLAAEAVQAARRQSETAGEQLDLALRSAFFVRSRCISLRHEILTAAAECPAVDVERLASDLDGGTCRAAVMRQATAALAGAADCSGYVVLPDGSGRCNPGVRSCWIGPSMPRGAPALIADDPSAYDAVLRAAARWVP
jgi:predicted DsbA family dithiol-disulfide isomerase